MYPNVDSVFKLASRRLGRRLSSRATRFVDLRTVGKGKFDATSPSTALTTKGHWYSMKEFVWQEDLVIIVVEEGSVREQYTLFHPICFINMH